jgi:hypothetical protein
MNVTITNLGPNPENVTLTLSADITTLDSENVLNLLNGTSTTLACLGNTSSCAYGNYTLSVYCQPSGVNEAANNFTYTGSVTVSIPGDITGPNGVPDGKVDMRDIAVIARCFGSTPSSSNWNPNADINGDGTVNMKDIALVARNFGNHT